MKVAASRAAPRARVRIRCCQNTQPVQSVTPESSTTDVIPATTMLRMPKIATAAHASDAAPSQAYPQRQRSPRENWSAASRSERAVNPVAAWWAKSHGSRRVTM